jgi:hypothetical protein
VITAAQIRRRLFGRPFQPFRIFLSDGSHHDVPHPEFAWVIANRVFVGLPGKNGDLLSEEMKELSILHVTRIEDLRAAKRRKRS